MRLTSSDGAWVELRPVRYQSGRGRPQADGGFDFDGNWVVIDGHVRTAEGVEYSFRDPCLLTDDLREISGWLKAVADRRVPPTPWPADEASLLAFTEPNIAFSVHADVGRDIRLRVHLSLEAGPPSRGSDRPGLYEYFVDLSLTPDCLGTAAEAWDMEIAAFPRR
ncbi:hypothetical protein CWIS_06680 [Cellulomonas sp. A375-1]|uniref:WapI family immunity protein n=1 Tax=Cellulomonas sp. A375-1 TaxID=1672219 RepID=UPI00065284FE|nr:hypothetical protein [Cellulomonas sp. A375-1]KMM46157.1 hypothetical protein CWIS_06680 [Cellulomonas sp. A375-1]